MHKNLSAIIERDREFMEQRTGSVGQTWIRIQQASYEPLRLVRDVLPVLLVELNLCFRRRADKLLGVFRAKRRVSA